MFLPVIANLQHLRLVARAFALLADQFDVRQELHLDRHCAVALAGFAAPAGNVERKVSGAEAALLAPRAGKRTGRGSRRMP